MNLGERILFNILFNSLFSFFVGLLIVLVAIKILRVDDGKLKVYLLTLPFAKIVADIFRGIPSDSYVWSSLDVLALPGDIGRWLSVDLGFAELGPVVSVKLSIGNAATKIHSLSVADMIYAWILKLGDGRVILAALWLSLTIAGVLATLRVARWIQFELQRRQDRASNNAISVAAVSLGVRTIDIYQSRSYAGSPFTGGMFKPYICFPTGAFERLSPTERDAVTKHELAHIKQWDVAQTLVIRLLGDIFWFVPFYRFLSRRIDACRELIADQTAVRLGVEPVLLAAALVKLAEVTVSPQESALYSAFLKRKSLIAIRVRKLTETSIGIPKQPHNWKFVALRVVGIAWVSGAVFSATLGGNYQIEHASKTSNYASDLVHWWLGLH